RAWTANTARPRRPDSSRSGWASSRPGGCSTRPSPRHRTSEPGPETTGRAGKVKERKNERGTTKNTKSHERRRVAGGAKVLAKSPGKAEEIVLRRDNPLLSFFV